MGYIAVCQLVALMFVFFWIADFLSIATILGTGILGKFTIGLVKFSSLVVGRESPQNFISFHEIK